MGTCQLFCTKLEDLTYTALCSFIYFCPLRHFICMYSVQKAMAPHSCLENPMDGGAWKAAVHGVAEGRTRQSDFTFTFHFKALEKEMATYWGPA